MKAKWMETERETERETAAMLAHDLRAPMCCAAGAAQLALAQARQGKAVDEQLRQILNAIASMDRMLKGMCDGEGIGDGIFAQKLERELRAMIAPRAAVKYQRMSIDLRALHGKRLPCAYDSLLRVLSNLLINAVKYTQEGGEVSLRGMLDQKHNGAECAIFVVSDSGMGMKKEFMSRMYDLHARAQEGKAVSGRGLGLAIVQKLVREMDGEIEAASEWGRGTVFTVRIALAKGRNQ